MRRSLGLVLVLTLVLAVGAGAWVVFRPSASSSVLSSFSSPLSNLLSPSTPDVSVETHEDAERGFAFDYPQTWQYIGDEDLKQRNERFVVGVAVQNLPGMACGMMVDERTVELEYSPQEVIAELDRLLEQKLTGFNRLEAYDLEVKGLPSIFYSYNYTGEGTTIGARLEQYLIFALDRVYTFSCGCPEARFEEFKKDFDFILGSFRTL